MATAPAAAPGRHWVYLDDQRTHEVHAEIQPRAAREYLFSTTELPAGSRNASEAVIEEVLLDTTEKLQLAMRHLEERLALQGTYYRADAADGRWVPIPPPPAGARRLDLRAHEVPIPGAPPTSAKMALHHFHAGEHGRDTMLVTLPRFDITGAARNILAEVDFDFPHVDDGQVKVLHTRLATTTLRSQLVKQHIDLPTRGYAKLIEAQDYARAYGNGWLERTRETFRLAAARVLRIGRAEEPAPPKLEEYATMDAAELARAIDSERIQTLRDRYLTPQEAANIMAGGELSIRRYVQGKQRRADHHAAFDLSILQTALLVEYGLLSRTQALLDEEGAKLLRYVQRQNAHG